jgi:hypothetical protein
MKHGEDAGSKAASKHVTDSKIFELFMAPSFCADGSKKRPSRNTK